MHVNAYFVATISTSSAQRQPLNNRLPLLVANQSLRLLSCNLSYFIKRSFIPWPDSSPLHFSCPAIPVKNGCNSGLSLTSHMHPCPDRTVHSLSVRTVSDADLKRQPVQSNLSCCQRPALSSQSSAGQYSGWSSVLGPCVCLSHLVRLFNVHLCVALAAS